MATVGPLTGGTNRPEGLPDFASRHIVRAIVTGALQPGEKLSPTKLATELSISHIPVREALAALETSGHVLREPRRGFFVTELSLDTITDVYHWRQVLEDEAHRIAVPQLDKADLTRMRTINRDLAQTAAYSVHYLDLNREFHFIAFQRANSTNLIRFLTPLWDAARRYQSAMTSAAVPPTLLHNQHDDLIAAYEARNVDLVNALMAEHRAVTLNTMRALDSAGRAGTGLTSSELLLPG